MTVNSTTNKVRYVGNGAATTWPYTFEIPTAGDLGLYYTDTSGVTTLIDPSLYTVTGIGSVNGGVVTYPLSGGPIAANTILEILRTVPYTQEVDLINQDGFYPQVVENGLDALEMQIQQLVEVQGRNLTVGVTDTSPGTLPAAAARANQLLGFDSSGNAIAAQPSSAPVSTPMQPVVDAASLAAARTALGLGTVATEGIGSGLQDDGAGNIRTFFKVVQDAGNKTVDVTYHAQQHLATGAISYSMPRANTLFNGFGFAIAALTAAVTINVNAADNFEGLASGASLIIPPGAQVFVSTDAASSGLWATTFTQLVGFDAPLNMQINASVAANALTISLKDRNGNDPSTASPILLAFRDPTIANGGPIIRVLTSALQIFVPNTATLGTSSGVAFRLWLTLFDNAGTLVLGAYLASTSTSIKSLVESVPTSGIAVVGGSNSAQTHYTGSAVTSKSFRIIGFLDFSSGQVSAGAWATAPDKIQLFGPGIKKPGDLIQRIFNQYGTGGNGANNYTQSNTAPTTATTNLITSQAVTPTASPNLLCVRMQANLTQNSGSGGNLTLAAMQDAGATALAVTSSWENGNNQISTVPLQYQAIAGQITSTTFKMYAAASAGSVYWNANSSGTSFFAGLGNTFIEIEELMG